jgi:hypothetical protein
MYVAFVKAVHPFHNSIQLGLWPSCKQAQRESNFVSASCTTRLHPHFQHSLISTASLLKFYSAVFSSSATFPIQLGLSYPPSSLLPTHKHIRVQHGSYDYVCVYVVSIIIVSPVTALCLSGGTWRTKNLIKFTALTQREKMAKGENGSKWDFDRGER